MAGSGLSEEFLEGFLVEAQEHLTSSDKQILAIQEALRRGAPQPKAVRELFRALHTIKGLSAMIGAEPIADLGHEMEALVRSGDRAGGRISHRAVDLLLEGLREIRSRVDAISKRHPIEKAPAGLLEALAGAERAEATGKTAPIELGLPPEIDQRLTAGEREQLHEAARAGKGVFRVDFEPSAERSERGVGISGVRSKLTEIGELVKIVPTASPSSSNGLKFVVLLISERSAEELVLALNNDVTAQRLVAIEQPKGEPVFDIVEDEPLLRDYVRVDVARLDDALDQLSSLMVTRMRMSRAVSALGESGADIRELSQILIENTRQLRDLRAAIMSSRMIPVSELLQRVPLIVRGVIRGQKKQVKVVIETGRAEVDKSVGDRLFPALVHLVRNAVDHAIEPPEERQRSGKSQEGLVRIRCLESSGTHLELFVSDDGRGIDPVALAKKAGVEPPENEEALLALICRPGFSTRDSADKTSGRGMGMDIAKRTVESLGGAMSIQTKLGAGTTFRLSIPVNVTIVDAFGFSRADQSFVSPVSSVEEIIEVDPARLMKVPSGIAPLSSGVIERRGEAIVLVPLERALGLPALETPPKKALIVRSGKNATAFGVDRMLGHQEVVIRPLEDPLVRQRAFPGATDLGDGKVTLVLDLTGLGSTLSQQKRGLSS